MKSYKIELLRINFTLKNGPEKIRAQAEEFINRKTAAGCTIISVSFDVEGAAAFCYITYHE